MIVTSEKKMEPGKYYDETYFNKPFANLEQSIIKYRFLVIRECTLEEYRNHLNEIYPKNIADRIMDYEYFYEIHTD